MTDIMESIADELPDASEIEGPDVVEEDCGYLVSTALNLNLLHGRLGFHAKRTDG